MRSFPFESFPSGPFHWGFLWYLFIFVLHLGNNGRFLSTDLHNTSELPLALVALAALLFLDCLSPHRSLQSPSLSGSLPDSLLSRNPSLPKSPIASQSPWLASCSLLQVDRASPITSQSPLRSICGLLLLFNLQISRSSISPHSGNNSICFKFRIFSAVLVRSGRRRRKPMRTKRHRCFSRPIEFSPFRPTIARICIRTHSVEVNSGLLL